MNIELYYNREAHVSRLITGFHLLATTGAAKVVFMENKNNFRKTPHAQVAEAVINGKIVAFDMSDAFSLNNAAGKRYLSRVDLYFKRSYSPEMEEELSLQERCKIRPFGFDYYVTYPQNPLDIPDNFPARCMRALRNALGYDKCMAVHSFEGKANFTDCPSILFMTRLWDPGEISLNGNLSPELRTYREHMIEERIRINADRIRLLRTLRKQYGDSFFGGIQDSAFAQKMCPDLILPKKYVRKKAYLSRMKESDICIGSTGLHNSIGWKTGEYVAAARAIVAERFMYQVPGNFMENVNYIPFDGTDECLIAVERLYHSPDAVYQMKLANEQYYQAYLRPEKQIMNALMQLK